jgi:hypothetical protein
MRTSRPAGAALALLACAAAAAPPASYYPLAVGNTWTYRCSVEGAPAAGKVLRIVGTAAGSGTGSTYYRAALTVGNDPRAVITYLSREPDGSVWQGPRAGPGQRELIAPAATAVPARGQRLSAAWIVGGVERLRLPALARAEALRLENFAVEAPGVSAERRSEWLARYFVLGIGPVAEADGLGGQCELLRYRLNATGDARDARNAK